MNLLKDDTEEIARTMVNQIVHILFQDTEISSSKAPIQAKENTSKECWSSGPVLVIVFGSTGKWDCPLESTDVGCHE